MADENMIVELCLLYLRPEDRPVQKQLVQSLVQSVVKTISGSHEFKWREKYTDITYDSSDPVYTVDVSELAVISTTGVAPIDASGDPNGKPLVYMDERTYHFERPANDVSTGHTYYIPLAKTHGGKRQIRFWPNITANVRLWYYEEPRSQHINHIPNEMLIVSGVLMLMPEGLVRKDKQKSQTDFYKLMRDFMRQSIRDKAAIARVTTAAISDLHNKHMREIQS